MAGDKAEKMNAQRPQLPATQSAASSAQAMAGTPLGRVAETIRTSPVMQARSAAAAGLRGPCNCDPAVPRDPVRRDVAQRSAMRAPAFDPKVIQRMAAPNRTGLPDHLKANIEAMSGFAMDDVRVHRNSAKPAQLQAHAYTQGSQIHLGPGQEKHLPHEAWHVVQQKQGRVKPTLQMKGVAINDENRLEREADAMGRITSHIASLGTTALGGSRPKGITVQRMLSLSNLHRTGLRSANVSPSAGSDDKKSHRRVAVDDKKSRMVLSEAQQTRLMKDLNEIVEIDAGTFQDYFDGLFRGDKATTSQIARACMRVKDKVDDLDLNERTKRDIRSEIKDAVERAEYQEKVKAFAAVNFAQPIAQDYTSIMKADGGIEQLVNEAKEAAVAKYPFKRLGAAGAYQMRLENMGENFVIAVGKILHKAMQAHPDERKALSFRLLSRGGIFEKIAKALFQESIIPAVRIAAGGTLDAKNYQTGADEKSAIPIVFYKKKEDYNLLKTIEPKVKGGAFKTLKLGEEYKLPYPFLGKVVGKPNFDRIKKGATLKDNSQHGSNRPNSGKFREMLNTYYVYNSSHYDIDHIWDLGFGGKDDFSNLWPLDPGINRRPIGGWRSAYLLHYKDNHGALWRGPIATLYAKWFEIKGFMPASGGDIPAESGKPEAGKK